MKALKKISYGIIIFILFIKCTEIIEIDTTSIQSKIVLNGVIDADSTIEVYLSRSYPYIHTDTFNSYRYIKLANLENPSVKLYINDISKGNMNDAGIDSYNGAIFTSDYRPKVGDLIKIEVSAPGFKSVWAETQIPEPIIIQKIDTATFYEKKENDSKYYYNLGNTEVPFGAQNLNLKLKIDIQNKESNKTNYYSLSIFQRINNSFYINAPKINVTNEPLLNENNAKNAIYAFFSEKNDSYTSLFTDNTFTNNKYSLNLSIWGYYFYSVEAYYDDGRKDIEMHNSPIEISITSLSKECYDYYKLSFQKSSYEEIPYIFDTKSTYSNVHNGIGVLCSKSISKKLIELPPFTGKIFSDEK